MVPGTLLALIQTQLNTACASDVSACDYTERAFLSKPHLKMKRRQTLEAVHDPFLSPSLRGFSPYSHLHLKESNPPSFCHDKKMRVVRLHWALPPRQDPPRMSTVDCLSGFSPPSMSEKRLMSQRLWCPLLLTLFKDMYCIYIYIHNVPALPSSLSLIWALKVNKRGGKWSLHC